MSSPFSFCRRRLPSTMTISRGIGPHLVPISTSASPSFRFLRQFASFSKECRRPVKPPLLCYHRSLCVGFGTSNFRQMRSSAGPRSILTDIYSNKKPYHAHLKAAKATKLRNLARWLSYPNFRRKQIKQSFDLGFVFRMLNTIFFGNLLHDRVKLKWKDPMGKLDYLSKTTLTFDDRRGPCAEIEIGKPLTNGPWTPAMALARYNALLHSMTWAFSEIYCPNCVLFQQSNNRAARGRRSGYGSPFERLLQEVKQEANRISKELPRPWDFRIYSCVLVGPLTLD